MNPGKVNQVIPSSPGDNCPIRARCDPPAQKSLGRTVWPSKVVKYLSVSSHGYGAALSGEIKYDIEKCIAAICVSVILGRRLVPPFKEIQLASSLPRYGAPSTCAEHHRISRI